VTTATPQLKAPESAVTEFNWPEGEEGKRLVEHLKLVQAVIARMNHNSFVVKAWSATLTGALLALAFQKPEHWAVAWAAPAAPLMCWWLDAFYLRAERRFRELFDALRNPTTSAAPFTMNPEPFVTPFSSWSQCLRGPVVAGIHGPVLGAAIVAALLLARRYG